jgi:hypothetical protein
MNALNNPKTEKGQVLILIAVGIVGLIAMVALAIDGGNAFADRRSAQNAADTAAYAAILAYLENDSDAAVEAVGLLRASQNRYSNDGTNVVTVTIDPDFASHGCTGRNGRPSEGALITVEVLSSVDTYFAGIVGVERLNNRVAAVTRGCRAFTSPTLFGSAVVGLNPGSRGVLVSGGSGTTTIRGSGVLVNSSHNCAVDGNAPINIPDGALTVVGGICNSAVNASGGTQGTTQLEVSTVPGVGPAPNIIVWPDPVCRNNGSTETVDGVMYFSPGIYGTGGAPGFMSNVGSTRNFVMRPGVYCIHNNWTVNAQFRVVGSEILIYQPSGSITVNGGAIVLWSAASEGEFAGLLIYQPWSNTNTITLAGGGDSQFIGTILAPSALVKVSGGSSAAGFNTQIVGWEVSLTGGAGLDIVYEDSQNYDSTNPAAVELVE